MPGEVFRAGTGGKRPVLILFGPTASGKTSVLEELFAAPASLFPAEIISADSMQVYRGMDIGTAKPGAELTRRLPHHLIDIRDPDEDFNAGDFVRLAGLASDGIAARGKLPVISGGTGFYLKNFIFGLPEAPPSNPEIRKKLKEELRDKGMPPLARELAVCDPVSAERIHIHDEYRLLRALEVYRLTGQPLSSFRPGTAALAVPGGEADGPEQYRENYRFLIIGLRRERKELYSRIDERCALMFEEGLAEEAAALAAKGYGPEAPGMRAIGYREFFFSKEDGGSGPGSGFGIRNDLDTVRELVARNSRRYAKRQMTYFSSLKNVNWIDAGDKAADRIGEMLRAFLALENAD